MFVPLVDQFVFGPSHVDTIGCGGCTFVIHGSMRGCVAVVDQLGLTKDRLDDKKSWVFQIVARVFTVLDILTSHQIISYGLIGMRNVEM